MRNRLNSRSLFNKFDLYKHGSMKKPGNQFFTEPDKSTLQNLTIQVVINEP